LFILDERIEPISYIDYKKWLGSMNSEMDSMYTNQVWTLIDPPEEIKLIEFSWVFKRKTNMDINVQTYKARLVTKGYRQRIIGWLWWNLLTGKYVKICKSFAYYIYIPWLWNLTNGCQNCISKWESSRRYACDTT